MDALSETDLNLFKSLMNPSGLSIDPDALDMIFSKMQAPQPQTARIEVLPPSPIATEKKAMSKPSAKTTTNPVSPLPTPKSDLDLEEEEEEEEEEEQEEEEVEKVDEEEEEDGEMKNSLFHEKMQQMKAQPSLPKRRIQPPKKNVPLNNLFRETEFIPEDFGEVDVEAENRDPSIRREKQEILFTLLKTYSSESKGQWSIKMPLFELKYELMRREQFTQEQDQLAFMKDMMKMILTGIEVANESFGPFLKLEGWAKSVTGDMSRYDRCLRALYLRYFRKKQMNPILELLWLIVGSAIMWHLKSKFLGGNSSDTNEKDRELFDNVQDIKPPPGKVPFSRAGAPKEAFNIGSILKLFAR